MDTLLRFPTAAHVTKLRPSPPRKSQTSTRLLDLPLRRKTSTDLRAGARGFGAAGDKSNDGGGKPTGEDDEIPQVVFDRMLRRILVFVGSPMAAGVGLLYFMSALKERGLWNVPPWLPFVCTLVSFGTSALGIAYGTLSSSWEPEREGSLLGWEEAQKNWPELWKDEEDQRKR